MFGENNIFAENFIFYFYIYLFKRFIFILWKDGALLAKGMNIFVRNNILFFIYLL